MTENSSNTPPNSGLIGRPDSGLVNLDKQALPAMSEIINRSLFHIQTSKTLDGLHRIGTFELRWPDYQLVCLLAEDFCVDPDVVMSALFTVEPDTDGQWQTRLTDGRFRTLRLSNYFPKIKSFPYVKGLQLEKLFLPEGEISSIDLSIFSRMTWFWCESNRLSELDISVAPHLTHLCCNSNQITSLDLSVAKKLTFLSCKDNLITNLNVTALRNITTLSCCENSISQLDLRNAEKLTDLWCRSNQLSKLDLSLVPNLKNLWCEKNRIKNLDLSKANNLNALSCYSNQLPKIDLTFSPQLSLLLCSDNDIDSLDFSNTPYLKTISCNANPLNTLDIRPINELQKLNYDVARTRLIQRPDQNF